MRSHYTNIISIACFFLCLYVASARSSLIQQVTDGFSTSQQLMQPSEDKGRPPSTYSIKNTDDSDIGVTISNPIFNPGTFNWTFTRFSSYLESKYTELTSDTYQISGGTKWNVRVLPTGQPASKTLGLSVYLVLDKKMILEPFQRVNVIANLRVLNQQESNTVQRRFGGVYSAAGAAGGFNDVVSQADLRDPSKGFVVNDELRAQVEFLAVF